ncbi:hypothetical protein G3N57_06640 [Paraburkholderia sp. Se-20369]|nr:hypothetical protein [Paraburkholderia sp. Se-20369]TCW80443.1 hypothetical protein C5O80_26925 [Burkholderia sp. SRS-46]
MIRYFLAQGDRAGSAVIVEGLPTVTCSNPPPSVHIATLDMKTYCTACNQDGYIAPQGPRWPGTGPNGKGWALSGDINFCGCNPPPIFHAERGMYMTFGGEATIARTEPNSLVFRSLFTGSSTHDEQFVLHDADSGRPLARVRYRIRTASGQVLGGVTGADGHTQRVTTTSAEQLHLDIYHDHG